MTSCLDNGQQVCRTDADSTRVVLVGDGRGIVAQTAFSRAGGERGLPGRVGFGNGTWRKDGI